MTDQTKEKEMNLHWNNITMGLCVALLMTAVLWMGNPLFGQLQNGNIVGSITDPNDELVPGARVVVTNELTKSERSTVTASDGAYVFQLLPAAPYTVTVEMSGFKKYVNRGVIVDVGRSTRVDIKLDL